MPDRNQILKVGDAVVVLPGKSPDEIFLMALCVVTALPIFFGVAPPPGSINSLLPNLVVTIWSAVLVVGAGTVLVSFTFKDRVTGMIVEQFGSMCLGVAATIYGVGIFLTSYDEGGAFSSAIILGFALARFAQFRSYQKTLNKVSKVRALVEKEVRGD